MTNEWFLLDILFYPVSHLLYPTMAPCAPAMSTLTLMFSGLYMLTLTFPNKPECHKDYWLISATVSWHRDTVIRLHTLPMGPQYIYQGTAALQPSWTPT